MRSSRSRRSSRRTTASIDLDAAVGGGERLVELGQRRHPEVRRAGGGAEGGQVDAVRRAEEPVVAVGVLRRALLEHGEDRAAVVVDDHDRQVGPRLVGAEDEPVAVVEEGDVAEQRQAAVGRCGRGRRRSRWRRRRRCRTGRGWRPPCGGRRRGSAAPSGRGRGSGWRRRRRAGPRAERPRDRAGDVVRREVGLGGEQRVEVAARPARRRRASGRASRWCRASEASTRSKVPATGNGRRGPGRWARRAQTSTSSRASSRETGRESVGWPKHDDPLDLVGQRASRAGAGRCGSRGCRCASRSRARPAAATAPARPGRAPAVRRRRRPPRPSAARPGSSYARGRAPRTAPSASGSGGRRRPHRSVRHQRLVELDVEMERSSVTIVSSTDAAET